MPKVKTVLYKLLRYKSNGIYNYIVYKLTNFTIITVNNITFVKKHFYILIKKRYRSLLPPSKPKQKQAAKKAEKTKTTT